MRRFNTAGPCRPAYNYMIPPERRMPEAVGLVDHQACFTLHAPRDGSLERRSGGIGTHRISGAGHGGIGHGHGHGHGSEQIRTVTVDVTVFCPWSDPDRR